MTSCHDSHFLLLLYLLLLLLVVLHDLQPLSLHQTALLDVELLFCLQGDKDHLERDPFNLKLLIPKKCIKTNIDLDRA